MRAARRRRIPTRRYPALSNSRWRNSIRRIFPVSVFGSVFVNSIRRGYTCAPTIPARRLRLVGERVGRRASPAIERLDDVAAALVGRCPPPPRPPGAPGRPTRPRTARSGSRPRIGSRRRRGLVPDVAVRVDGDVLGVEPLASGPTPGAPPPRCSSSRAGSAGSSARAGRSRRARVRRGSVLIEDLHVSGMGLPIDPSRTSRNGSWRPAGRTRSPVVVEHGDAVLLAEPADRLRVERLAGAADDAELLQ